MGEKKRALVLEGGAMQGIYTAGVLDEFMEQNVTFDAIIGVSAGALFGVNFLSRQKGRVLRYCKKYNKRWDYLGILPLLSEGNIISTKLAYGKVPREWDIFDDDTFVKSQIPFYVVVTNIETGEAEYMNMKSVFEQMDLLRASGSMPFVSKPVSLNGSLYLDGAIADSIPFQKMLDLGYEELVVVLTKSEEYVKKPIFAKLSRFFYQKKYPLFEEKVRNRHLMYRQEQKDLERLKREGIAKVIRPSRPCYISKIEKKEEKLDELYQLGVKDARIFLKLEK